MAKQRDFGPYDGRFLWVDPQQIFLPNTSDEVQNEETNYDLAQCSE